MKRYLARRLALGVVAILGVTVLAFAAVNFLPSDAVSYILGMQGSPEAAEALRHRLGLDLPPHEQYIRWLAGVLQGDLGTSLITREPVFDLLCQRVPVTLQLTFMAGTIAILL